MLLTSLINDTDPTFMRGQEPLGLLPETGVVAVQQRRGCGESLEAGDRYTGLPIHGQGECSCGIGHTLSDASRSRIGFSSPRNAPKTEIGTSVTTISRMM